MERKLVIVLIGFIISILTFLAIGILALISSGGGGEYLLPREYVMEFIPLIPGNLVTDVIILFALPVGFFLIFYYISPYLIKFYIYVHKFFYWLLRRPSQYGVFIAGKKVKAGRLAYRALIASLFAFSISALIVELGFPELFRAVPAVNPDMFDPTKNPLIILNMGEAVFFGTFLLCAFIVILFFPIWLLEDSGVVSYRVFHGERMPADIQGVHSLYLNILLGYAGLSTIITLVRYISGALDVVKPTDPAFLTPMILIVLPFIGIGLLFIPIYLYERFFQKCFDRLHSKLEILKFPEITIPQFEELKK